MENEILILLKKSQLQIFEVWLNFFQKDVVDKKTIIEAITTEIESLKKEIENL